jgi:type IV pilus assembly protein PilQ
MMIINIESAQNIKKIKFGLRSAVAQRFAVFFFATLLVFGFSCPSLAADVQAGQPAGNSAPIVITGISIEDDVVNIKVQGPIKYSMQKTADPFLVTVLIEGASVGQFRDKIMSKSRGIIEVSPAQIEVPSLAARLDIMLQAKNEVKAELKEDILSISIDRSAIARPAVQSASDMKNGDSRDIKEVFKESSGDKPVVGAAAKVDAVPEPVAPKEGSAREITEIFFDKDKNVVELVIKADGKLGEPAVYQLDGSVILEIPGVKSRASIPSKMINPVKDISIKNENDKLRIVVNAQEGTQSEVYILEDELLIDFSLVGSAGKKTLTETMPAERGKIANGGKVVSLDFQDADIVPIIRLLGDVSGYNMVVHPDVKGKITMKLMNVPWTQALDIIIKTFNLEKVVEGNIIRIATVKAFQEEKKATADNKELFGKAEDIVTKVFVINNANVVTLKESIEKGKILTPRGTVSADVRTRVLIIKDIQSSIDGIEKLLVMLDKPTKQVLIEARIVEMKSESAQSLGVEWGMTGKASGVLGTRGDSLTTKGSASSSVTGGNSGTPTLFNMPALTSALAPQTGAITFGYLTADKTLGLDLRLSAIGSTNKIRILASPKILTLDNQEAIIKQGQKIPVLTQTPSSTGVPTYSVTYIEATLKLTVTPQIAPGGRVIMKIELIRDEPNEKSDPVLGNPYIDIRLASTQVALNNGETLVIGGIINNRETKTGSNVPGVSTIPLIGNLFKRESTETSNLELLIFLTPRLMQ